MQGSLRQAIDRRRAAPRQYPVGRFDGRGIVICAGGLRYFTCAWVLIFFLRRVHRVALPIQVWHLGKSEMSDEMRLLLEEEGVEVVDAEQVVARHPARIAGGWPLKPYAIVHSRFREVLYLDADTIPMADPLAAFHWEGYRDAGLVLWPDVVDIRRTNPVWGRVGLPEQDAISIESCALVVDKQRAWPVLDMALLLNESCADLYDAIYGDKDTFLLAPKLLDEKVFLIPHRPFPVGWDLLQRAPDGSPFLVHRTASKWHLHSANQPLPTQPLTQYGDEALAELRRRWSGAIFHPPVRSLVGQAEERRLIGVGRFLYDTSNGDRRCLHLQAAGRIGDSEDRCERHWAVVERDGSLVLQFFSSTHLIVEQAKRPDGSWHGASIVAPWFSASLINEASRRTWPHAAGERVERSAEHLVAALLDPALFSAGFDATTEQRLSQALSLFNGLFDDVPERVLARLQGTAIPEPWRASCRGIAADLARERDERLASTSRGDAPPGEFERMHYTRVI